MKKIYLVVLIVFVSILGGCTTKSTPIIQSGDIQTSGTLVFEEEEVDQSNNMQPPIDNFITKVRLYQIIKDPTIYTWTMIKIWCEDMLGYFDADTEMKENEKYTKIFDLIHRYDNESNGYYNPWKSQSDIEFYSYELSNNDKDLSIYLSGTITLGGVCDVPRVIETIKSTYRGFGFDDVHIFLNNTPIDDALGGKWVE